MPDGVHPSAGPDHGDRLGEQHGAHAQSFGAVLSRQDAIGAYVFTTTYGYDGNDDVRSITYPTGRIISYDPDSEHQIQHVYETAAGRDYAFGMTYHPSGGLATSTAGNSIATSMPRTSQRGPSDAVSGSAIRSTTLIAMKPPMASATGQRGSTAPDVRGPGSSSYGCIARP